MASQRRAPNSDYFHFTGRGKPWYHDPPKDISRKWESAKHFWFYQLSELNGELQMGLHFQNWTTSKRASLGMNAMFATIHTAKTNLLEVY
jgi:lipopolysaccharide biosynthesis glycosyltransferase